MKGLRLGNSIIKIIPCDVDQFYELSAFCLERQYISALPAKLFTLTKLEVLRIGYNKLSFIPKEIGNLKSLRILEIYGNELSYLPKEIKTLSNLTFFLVNYNTFPRINILYNMPQKILDALSKITLSIFI